VKSSETDLQSVVNCGNTLSPCNKDSGKKRDGGYVSEILTDEEDVVPRYNARKYEYLKMKVTSTTLRYSVLVLFVNKYHGLETIAKGDDMQST
jgi:hypothetical protein